MSANSQWDVQRAVYTALKEDATLTNLLAEGEISLYDSVPEKSNFPYVTFGKIDAKPFGTQNYAGMEMIFTLQSWSQYHGMQELRSIMARVYNILHENTTLNITGQALIFCRLQNSTTGLKGDGLTRLGTQMFKIITEPTT